MFPHLLPRIGKGDAARGIQKQIMRHIPDCYKPIMRMVSTLFNECVEQKFERMPDQLAILQTLVKHDDLKLLKFYNEQMYWNIADGELLQLAFEAKASLPLIAYLYQHLSRGTDVGQVVDDPLVIHNRQDVFDHLIKNTLYKPGLVGFVYEAVSHMLIWPFEWIIKNNIVPDDGKKRALSFSDIFDCIANSDVDFPLFFSNGRLNQPAVFWLRQLLGLMIDYTFDFAKFSHGLSSFYSVCFFVFANSNRDSDYQLFLHFHRKFYAWTNYEGDFVLAKEECVDLSTNRRLESTYLKLLKADHCECKNKKVHRG